MANTSSGRNNRRPIGGTAATPSGTSSPDAPKRGLQALGCLLLVGTLLALSFVLAKLADESGAPRLTFLMSGLSGAGLILLSLSALRGRARRLNGRMLEYALVTGVLLALPNALGFLAVRHVGAGFLSMSFAFPVLVTWLIAVLIGMERLRWLRLLGVMLGLAGALVLALSKAFTDNVEPLWAGLILALPFSLALGNIYRTLRWPDGAEPVYLAALMMAVAAAALLPFALTFEPGQMPALFASTKIGTLLLAEIAVFSVLYLFYFVLQKIAGPVYLSQMGTVAAVVGTLVAVFGLGETPPPYFALAVLLVGTGTVVFHLAAARSRRQGGRRVSGGAAVLFARTARSGPAGIAAVRPQALVGRTGSLGPTGTVAGAKYSAGLRFRYLRRP